MARRTNARKHTHRYALMKDGLWHCTLPDCSHYWPGNMPIEALYGKKTICWDCGQPFSIDEISMRIDRPICSTCESPRLIEEILTNIMEK